MRILHTGTFDVNAGGPAMSTYLTMLGLRQLGIDAELFMYPLSVNGRLRGEEVPVHYASAPLDNRLLYSFSYKKEMLALGDYDIYHAQGVWQYPTYAIADIARKKGKPYIITPRGMLYPQGIAKSNRFFKELSLKIRLLNDLNKAACVQVTCEDEMNHCRALGVIAPIAIIPNPVQIEVSAIQKKDEVFRLGYLGRLSPRKNVESLIYAFDMLRNELRNAELIIIGGGDDVYESFLKSEVNRLQLTNVVFTGFLSGKEKEEAITSVSVLAMPSEYENLGNVILEGLVRGIPCIATKGSPWSELITHKCGWWVDYNQQAITEAIMQSYQTSNKDIHEMGVRGQELMRDHYSIKAISSKMNRLYQWVKTNQNKPEFIYG